MRPFRKVSAGFITYFMVRTLTGEHVAKKGPSEHCHSAYEKNAEDLAAIVKRKVAAILRK